MAVDVMGPSTADKDAVARAPIRPGYLAAGVALLLTAIGTAVRLDTGVSSVLLFVVLPDLAMLLGLGQPHTPGQLPRRAVPAYNLLHHPVMPLALVVAAATGLGGGYWLVAATAWAAHIAVDRGAGFGLRTRDGWQRG